MQLPYVCRFPITSSHGNNADGTDHIYPLLRCHRKLFKPVELLKASNSTRLKFGLIKHFTYTRRAQWYFC